MEEVRSTEVEHRDKEMGGGDVSKGSKEDSDGAEESDGGWVLEGGNVDRGLELEVKRYAD